MKIIDEKGKLFKIINLFDLLVIIVVIILVGFIGYKAVNGKEEVKEKVKQKEIYFYAKATMVPEEYCESLIQGSKIVAQQKYQDGIIDKIEYRPAKQQVTTDDGKVIETEHQFLKDIVVGIKCTPIIDGNKVTIGGQEIKVGLPYWIKTDRTQILGLVYKIEE